MSVLEGIAPERVFYYFEEISKIPHGSYNTKAISDYLVDFAKDKQLSYRQDESNNVIIFKNASAGYENAPVTILQGHCDMVCEKNQGSTHDFTKDPLQLCIDGDILYAKDTTLGGDDGIAVAYALAILEAEDIQHPALEVIITTDEEVGLRGATALDTSDLKGKYLLNMDSEDEGHLLAGCAGGMTAKSIIPLQFMEQEGIPVQITIDGLLGGHSGVEIGKKRINAAILMGRFLYELAAVVDYDLIDITGGTKDNVITKYATCNVLVSEDQLTLLQSTATAFEQNVRNEYAGSDEGVTVSCEAKTKSTVRVIAPASKAKVIFYLMNVPNGIQKMSGLIEGLVESSSNMGILRFEDDCFFASSSVRSSVASGKSAMGDKICFLTEFLGGEYKEDGSYPAWEYKKDSTLRDLMVNVYEKMYGEKPVVEVIHAGLECGLFYEKIPELDCISFGPNMKDIHTTQEKLSISSVKRTWDYILEVLKNIK